MPKFILYSKATVTSATEDHDRPLKSIFYLTVGVFIFSIQDVIIKWLSGKYPVSHQDFLLEYLLLILEVL